MIARKLVYIVAMTVLGLTSCVSTTNAPPAPTGQTAEGACKTADVTLDTKFPAGNVASCKITGENEFTVSLKPEDAPPINCSAWYAFRLSPDKTVTATQKINVKLDYEICGHRYWPKTSVDGISWTYLPQTSVAIAEVGDLKQASITINMDDKPLFVAAQEIIVPATYQAWIDKVAASEDVDKYLLGKSAEGRDIPALTIKALLSKPKEQVVLIGRQHPPEVTGALAMLPFVKTLLADTPLAQQYRERFETKVVPMLNPDGVMRGYWRHSTGHVDLNRDWGPFTQPETQLMKAMLDGFESDPNKNLRLFVDFHSTQNDIFYVIPDDYPTTPPLLVKNWLDRFQARVPNYEVKRRAGRNLDQANSKNFIYKRYKVPSMTYELGDETDRELIRKLSVESATAMMETLLATEAP